MDTNHSELSLLPLDMATESGDTLTESQQSISQAPSAPAQSSGQGRLLPINVRERAALYASYMSFVRGGGFFVPTNKPFKMGEEVLLLININIPAHHVEEKLPVHGFVVWITPESRRPGRVQGIGVQFTDDKDGEHAQRVIEGVLGRHVASTRETHTL
jgi:type IV pilus assembly protein PilZ